MTALYNTSSNIKLLTKLIGKNIPCQIPEYQQYDSAG